MSMSIILQLFDFLMCCRHIGITQLIEQAIYALGSFCHRFVERLLGIVLFAKQFGEGETRIGNLYNNSCVIKLTANTFTGICHIELATDVTVVQILHYRNGSSRFEIKKPAFETFLLRISAKHSLGVIVQTCQQCLIGNEHRPRVGSLKHILTILKRQFAQFGG